MLRHSNVRRRPKDTIRSLASSSRQRRQPGARPLAGRRGCSKVEVSELVDQAVRGKREHRRRQFYRVSGTQLRPLQRGRQGSSEHHRIARALVDGLPSAPHHRRELFEVVEQLQVLEEEPVRLVLLDELRSGRGAGWRRRGIGAAGVAEDRRRCRRALFPRAAREAVRAASPALSHRRIPPPSRPSPVDSSPSSTRRTVCTVNERRQIVSLSHKSRFGESACDTVQRRDSMAQGDPMLARTERARPAGRSRAS